MKPFVGVTCAWSEETGLKNAHSRSFNYIEAKYQEAVYRYGGVPVLIPPPREDAPDLDGYAEEVLCRPGAVTRLSDDVEVGVVGEPVSTASVTKELLADGAVPAPRLDCH